MLKNEREREIIEAMKDRDGRIGVKELCSALYASESSIRRDLAALENRGLIKRTRGGAELLADYSGVVEFRKRTCHNVEAKKAIAEKAAGLIEDGNVLFLDQSSTSFYLARAIMDRNSLTIVTNNVEIISLMADTRIKTIASGGYLSGENRVCLLGADAQYIFEHMFADLAFFSAKALSDEGIVYDCTREEVLVRGAMIRNARKKAFLCDSEKFHTRAVFRQCGLGELDYLISEDREASEAYRACAKSLTIL